MTTPQPQSGPEHVRDQVLDGLRGLAMLLVVAGHTLGAAYPDSYLTNPLQIVLYSFHLPLFAAVSGFVTRGREGDSTASFVWKRFRALIIPYLSWYIIWAAFSALRERQFEGFLSGLVEACLSPRADNALWFLYALFLVSIGFALVRTIAASDRALLASALLAAAVFTTGITRGVWLLDADRVVWLYIFFSLGNLAAGPLRLRLRRRGRQAGIALAVYLPALTATWAIDPGGTTLISRTMGASPLALPLERLSLIAAAGAASVLLLALFDWAPQWLSRPFAVLGTRSVGIYATHKRIIFLALEGGASGFLVPFVASLTSSTLIAVTLERVPWVSQVLLGRPPASPR